MRPISSELRLRRGNGPEASEDCAFSAVRLKLDTVGVGHENCIVYVDESK